MMSQPITGKPAQSKVHHAKAHALRLLLLIGVLLIQACATSSELTAAREQFRQGDAQGALNRLNEADVSRRDELLLLLDTGLIAQAAGQFEQSIAAFEKAYQLIEQLDYISVKDESSALFTSDWALRYSGELSERLWIHTFQMINYLMTDKPSGAAVEARRAVALYEEHSDILENDFFTRYLMALSFETAGQFDSAAVEYRRLAQMVGVDDTWYKSASGRQLVVMVASGFIEPKLPGNQILDLDVRFPFPYYPESYQSAPDIHIIADSRELPADRIDTRLLPISRSALAKRGKAIAARQSARLAAKYSLTENIEAQDELAGNLVKFFLMIIEQPDTRSWETLPAYLSLVKVQLPTDVASVDIEIGSQSFHHRYDVPLTDNDDKTQFHMLRTGIDMTLPPLASP